MKESEPTENVRCGQCSTINTVPFGLEKFRCFECGAIVAIARDTSAACAAASSVAQSQAYSDALDTPASATSSNPGGGTAAGGGGGGGFFGKLQKNMDKAMAKVNKTIENLTTDKDMPQKGDPSTSTRQGLDLSAEEEQLQWALNASLAEAKPAAAADDALVSAGSQPQVVAAQHMHRLQEAELRADRAENALAVAQAQEAAAVAERADLRRQLQENEVMINCLTEKLDAVNAELDRQAMYCQTLEASLATAQDASARAGELSRSRQTGLNYEDEFERQGAIQQLLAKAEELEGQLVRATHLEPEDPTRPRPAADNEPNNEPNIEPNNEPRPAAAAAAAIPAATGQHASPEAEPLAAGRTVAVAAQGDLPAGSAAATAQDEPAADSGSAAGAAAPLQRSEAPAADASDGPPASEAGTPSSDGACEAAGGEAAPEAAAAAAAIPAAPAAGKSAAEGSTAALPFAPPPRGRAAEPERQP